MNSPISSEQLQQPLDETALHNEEIKCPSCESTKINKNGHHHGKQNYICKDCGRQFIEGHDYKGHLDDVKRICLRMYVNGMEISGIEQATKINHSTIVSWLREAGHNLPEPPVTSEIIEREHTHDEEGNSMFGFIVFLLSESFIFLAFFAGYIAYKTTTPDWLPPGVSGLEIKEPAINTVVLVSSSFVIYLAERALERHNLVGFRVFLLTTMAMGSYFLFGQAIEWSSLDFGFTTGVFGGIFYLLTGFHGLHVLTGILLQTIIFARSFIPGNYNSGHFGVNATSLFWHFVDVIWIILFVLIYIWQ